MATVQGDMQRAVQRDDLYTSLIDAGVAPERAAAMVDKKLPYAPASSLRSEPLTNGKVVTRQRPIGGGDWAIGVALIVFGLIGWLAGAKYTLFGWVVGLNLFFTWLGLPITIPAPISWWVLALVPIGVLYSWVEAQVWRAHKRRGQALALFVAGWLIIVFTDVITTYLGVRTPPENAWPITVTIAASAFLSITWAAILTFVSDWLILGGWKLLRR